MSGSTLNPTEAEELLLRLRRSIELAMDMHLRESAVRFATQTATQPPAPRLPPQSETANAVAQLGTGPVREALGSFESQVESFTTPPPVPPTPRGRLGAYLYNIVHRALWWHVRQATGLAKSAGALARVLSDQTATQSATVVAYTLEFGALREHLIPRLESLAQSVQQLQRESTESRVIGRFEKRFADLREAIDQIEAAVRGMEQQAATGGLRLTSLESTLQLWYARLSGVESLAEAAHSEAQRLLTELGSQMRAREAAEYRITLLESRVEDSLRRVDSAMLEVRHLQEQRDIQAPVMDDALYVALEDRFRGTRDDVMNRQRVYVPILRSAGAGAADAPILDLGCGRGEFLELLKGEGMVARGVEANTAMIDICRKRGLEVAHSDFLSYMEGLPDSSVSAVTSMHMIEHLPVRLGIALLDHAMRIIRPGGLLVLETPNPRNVLVASRTFYLDPTHLMPLPCELLWFLFEMRGFVKLRSLELHRPSDEMVAPDSSPLAEFFRAPLDYAIVGERP